MSVVVGWFQDQWKAAFPYGFFVTTESEVALHLDNQEMSIPNEVLAGVAKGDENPGVGALYIGALYCVCNQVEVFNKNIRVVVNTSNDVRAFQAYQTSARRLKENLHVAFARLMWKDDDSQILEKADLEGAIKHIHAQRLRGVAVLIHCIMGKSRSAALTVSYLLALQKDKSVNECIEQVKAARPTANPRESFVTQLNKLKSEGFFEGIELTTASADKK
ncbi:hypothetical protein TrLO_g11714 [Triparma laevis f. longispina]|uniref:Uncharacterized protein n=1 Tax=Triparma laevis f. longispina TaxID=1714387 RepID=A0A9W6ZI73_9STRA|nr:hypothetical protein TrLO_g11714 [Triparma laevis f. longispina]